MRSRKIILFLYIIVFCVNNIKGQSQKELDLEKTVFCIIKYYNNKDSLSINKFVDSDFGIYILARSGAEDFAYHLNNISFSRINLNLPDPIPDILANNKIKEYNEIKHQSPGILDCYQENANEGIFIDNQNEKHLLSNTMKIFKSNNPDLSYLFPLSKILNAILIERKSHRILILKNTEDKALGESQDSFIFYLTYIKDRWVITIIDFITLDCSV